MKRHGSNKDAVPASERVSAVSIFGEGRGFSSRRSRVVTKPGGPFHRVKETLGEFSSGYVAEA